VSQALSAIQDGRQAFTIDQQQYWRGYIPVLLMAHYIKYGLNQANYFLTGPSVVDASNVDQVADLVTAPAPGPYR
jgi:simple sugar transport system substrate-binding protein